MDHTVTMDHRRFVASIPRGERARLIRRSDRPGLLHLAAHLGAVAALGWGVVAQIPGWPVLVVVQGVAIVFLFTPLHESVHRTAFATPWINRAVARLCGFALLVPAEWFRRFHLAHHRYTHDPGRDPELATPAPRTLAQYLVHLSGLPVWYGNARTLVRNALGRCDDAFVRRGAQRAVRREARWMLAAYAALLAVSLAAGSSALLLAWVIPALLGQPFLRLYLMAEHGRCPHVANVFESTRTTFTSRLVRALAWNMPYHAEHHAFPAVPWHRLPELHRLARPHLRRTERGYLRFHRALVRDL